MELLVSEHRNAHGDFRQENTVRIFLQRNYDYGYWINEQIVWNVLSKEQQDQYILDTYTSGIFDIDYETACTLLAFGKTPYNKQILRRDN